MDVTEKDPVGITARDLLDMMGVADIQNLDGRTLAGMIKMVNSVDTKTRERLVLTMREVTGFSQKKIKEVISVMSKALEEMYPDVFEEPPLN